MTEQGYTLSELENFTYGNKSYRISFKTGRFRRVYTPSATIRRDAGHGDGSTVESTSHGEMKLDIWGVGELETCYNGYLADDASLIKRLFYGLGMIYGTELLQDTRVTVVMVENEKGDSFAPCMVETDKGQAYPIYPVAKYHLFYERYWVSALWKLVFRGMILVFIYCLFMSGLAVYLYLTSGEFQFTSFGEEVYVRSFPKDIYLGVIAGGVAVVSLAFMYAISNRYYSAKKSLGEHVKKCVAYLQSNPAAIENNSLKESEGIRGAKRKSTQYRRPS